MNAEPVDEFDAATEGLTEGYFTFRYRGVEKVSGQYGVQHCHRMEVLDEAGQVIDKYTHYTETEMKRGNRQWAMMEGFLGRRIEAGERTSPGMIRNRTAGGDVELNKNGKPKVITWTRLAAPSPTTPVIAAAATTPQYEYVAAQPIASPRPLPPRPGVAPVLRTDQQRDEIAQLAKEQEITPEALDAWIAGYYPGKTIESVSPAEATQLIADLKIPF